MTINVKNALKHEGETFPVQISLQQQPIDFQGPIEFLEPIGFGGSISALGGTVKMEGELTTRLKLICSRCDEPFELPVQLSFSECFATEDEDCYPLKDGVISPDDALLGCVLLSLELQRLCSDECKGLCPVCGGNRNKFPCSCSQAAVANDNPFTALRRLMDDEEV